MTAYSNTTFAPFLIELCILWSSQFHSRSLISTLSSVPLAQKGEVSMKTVTDN